MRFTQSWLAVGAIVVSATLPSSSWAKSALDSRITRLENIVENELNISLINQLQSLQQEIQELRGKIEEQQNAISQYASGRINVAAKQDAIAEQNPVAEEHKNAPSVWNTQQIEEASVESDLDQSQLESIAVVEGQDDLEAGIEPIKDEKGAYDSAYRKMSSKKYTLAATEFKDFLWKYPDGTYAPNAYYWLGEIYLAQWQQNKADANLLAQAKEAFGAVLEKYSDHHKAIDALLKLGFIELDRENWLSAKELLSRVVKQHPGTSRARLAEARLQRMQQEGRL